MARQAKIREEELARQAKAREEELKKAAHESEQQRKAKEVLLQQALAANSAAQRASPAKRQRTDEEEARNAARRERDKKNREAKRARMQDMESAVFERDLYRRALINSTVLTSEIINRFVPSSIRLAVRAQFNNLKGSNGPYDAFDLWEDQSLQRMNDRASQAFDDHYDEEEADALDCVLPYLARIPNVNDDSDTAEEVVEEEAEAAGEEAEEAEAAGEEEEEEAGEEEAGEEEAGEEEEEVMEADDSDYGSDVDMTALRATKRPMLRSTKRPSYATKRPSMYGLEDDSDFEEEAQQAA